MTRRTFDQLRADLRDIAQEFTERMHLSQGVNADAMAGDVEALPGPAGSIVVRLPAHYPPHMAGDLTRFIDAQCEAAGLTRIAVIVTLGESVTVQEG